MCLRGLSYRSVYLMSRTVRCFSAQKLTMKQAPVIANFGKNKPSNYGDKTGYSGITNLGGINRPLYDLYTSSFQSSTKEAKRFEKKLSEELKNSLLPLSAELKKSIAFGKANKRSEDTLFEYNKYMKEYEDYRFIDGKEYVQNEKANVGREWKDKKKTGEIKKIPSAPVRTRKQEILLLITGNPDKPKNFNENQIDQKAKLYSIPNKEVHRKLLGLVKRKNNETPARMDEIHNLTHNLTPHFNQDWIHTTNIPNSRTSEPKLTTIANIKKESKKKMDQYFGELHEGIQSSSVAKKKPSSSASYSSYLLKGINIKTLKKQFKKNADMKRHIRKSVS